MRNDVPRVSIGLPVYNGENFIEEAIDSILTQTFSDFELLISDNASTDRTKEICLNYAHQDRRVRYYGNERNLGAALNYNKVFHLSAGDYFKWIGHDDLYAPNFLERCVEVLDGEPEVVLSYPQTIFIDASGGAMETYADGLDLRSTLAHERFRKFLERPGMCHPVFGLMRADILKLTSLIGNYPRSDRNLIGEIALWGQIYEIPEQLFFRRMHSKTSTEVNLTERELAVWFDPKFRERLVFPRARRFLEYIKSISHARIPLTQRLRCYALVGRYVLYPERWLGIGDDLVIALRIIIGSKE